MNSVQLPLSLKFPISLKFFAFIETSDFVELRRTSCRSKKIRSMNQDIKWFGFYQTAFALAIRVIEIYFKNDMRIRPQYDFIVLLIQTQQYAFT